MEPPRLTLVQRAEIASLKARIDPYAFIGQYVPLDEQGRGHCPFHPPDQRPSFAIDPKTGRWTDFHPDPATGQPRSGDIIDFYMKSNQCTLAEAIRALKDLLGVSVSNRKFCTLRS